MEKDKSYGPVIGLVIIILIIALGSVYFLQEREGATMDDATATEQASELSAITEQSSTDDVSSIETDLTATNIDTVDTGLSDIETAL